MTSCNPPVNNNPLNSLSIASPCTANWNEMTGDARVRFCGQCQLNVYNLSDMTSQEANELLMAKEGRLCVRYYQRADGTIITQDCPVGIQAKYRSQPLKISTRIRNIAAAITLITAVGVFTSVAFASKDSTLMGAPAPQEPPQDTVKQGNVQPVEKQPIKKNPQTKPDKKKHKSDNPSVQNTRPALMGDVAAPPKH